MGSVFFLKTNKNLFLFKENKNIRIKKQVGLFLKKRIVLNPDCLSILCVICPWSHDLVQVTSVSVWLSVCRTLRV